MSLILVISLSILLLLYLLSISSIKEPSLRLNLELLCIIDLILSIINIDMSFFIVETSIIVRLLLSLRFYSLSYLLSYLLSYSLSYSLSSSSIILLID